ncbi:non-ribosomal peptide synthetase [Dictyobacter halimunensis]
MLNTNDEQVPGVEQDMALAEDPVELSPDEEEQTYLFPASFAQERLWLLNQLEPENTAYNLLVTLELTGPLDVAALTASLNALVRRHETLRTSLIMLDGQLMQSISAEQEIDIERIDLHAVTLEQRTSEIQSWMRKASKREFKLDRGPLLHATLLQFQPTFSVLLVAIHHIIADGWSLPIFFQELCAYYNATVQQHPAELPELTIQYADYAVWQRDWLASGELDEQLTYWKETLSGAPALLDLPTDHVRPAVQTFQGCRHNFALSPALSSQIEALGHRNRTTLYMTLLAAFQILLFRYSGQDDILIGTPIAGRTRMDLEGIIGLFTNTLVLRGNLANDPSFHELLTRVRQATLDAYSNQDLPLERLVEELKPERNLSYNPLFQVMFIVQNTPSDAFTLADLTLKVLQAPVETAKFDLTLTFWQGDGTLHAYLEYNTDLFESATIQRMAHQLQTLLEGIVANEHLPISRLPLLSAQEQQQLVATFNAPPTTYPRERHIHHLFEAQAERVPLRPAIQVGEKQLAYQELNQQANQLARLLQHRGIHPGASIGICLERSADMLVAILAILKAGATYIPLDPDYPESRLKFIIQDANIAMLITRQALQERFQFTGTRNLCLDQENAAIEQEARDNLNLQVAAEQPAYLIYTSGSTGTPKGVSIPHSALNNFLDYMQKKFQLTEHDMVMAISSLSFDISALELFLPLSSGACIKLIRRQEATDGRLLVKLIDQSDITLMQATPSTWHMLIAAGWQGKPTATLLCGGEALPLDLAQQLARRGRELWNVYGPTEATIWATLCQIEAETQHISLGQPMDNVSLYVLDKQLQLVPIGVPGELYIGGEGIAHGYHHRPALTATSFLPDPFTGRPGARMYKTGDVVRYRYDHQLEYLGRADFQVKVRGHRIELGEIEACLERLPTVKQAVVTVHENQSHDQRIVAYLQTTAALTVAEVRQHLQRELPTYMVPSAFIMLDEWPLTPNGKIDRRVLPAPDVEQEGQSEFVLPINHVEEVLVQLWTQLLGIDQVSTNWNFFQLGGHSLLGTQLMIRIAETLKVELPLRTLFEDPTISGLAGAIERQSEQEAKRKKASPVRLTRTAQRLSSLNAAKKK